MEAEVENYLKRINELGGAVSAVEEGYMQREIHRTAYETQRKIEKDEEIIVGLNKFTIEEEVNPELLKVDEELEREQKAKLQSIKEKRDSEMVESTLKQLKWAASRSMRI